MYEFIFYNNKNIKIWIIYFNRYQCYYFCTFFTLQFRWVYSTTYTEWP